MKRPVLAAGVVLAIGAVAGTAFAARGFSDPTGDVNTAPDIASVQVSEATAGVLTLELAVGNFQTLPANSWVNLWFDTDSNEDTGAEGDEALVRHQSTGSVALYRWNGSQLVETPGSGIASSFAGGTLTVTVPRTAVAATGAFDLLVVTSRGQEVGDEQLIASDFAPNAGRIGFTGPATTRVVDLEGDNDAAPDITTVRVSDAKNGWITFDIGTPNYEVLPEASAVVVTIDADANARTGDGGAEVQVTVAAGQIALERWSGRQWVPDGLPTRARFRNARNAVSVDVHVSELGSSARFRFGLLAADVNTAIQAVVAVDVAPDDFSYWSYTLANKPALSLVAKGLKATPATPRAGRPFTVALSVTRSDTSRPIASGTVVCRVRVGGKQAAARGSLTGGRARCALNVPAGTSGRALRGTVTIRSGGATLAQTFAYTVR